MIKNFFTNLFPIRNDYFGSGTDKSFGSGSATLKFSQLPRNLRIRNTQQCGITVLSSLSFPT